MSGLKFSDFVHGPTQARGSGSFLMWASPVFYVIFFFNFDSFRLKNKRNGCLTRGTFRRVRAGAGLK